VTTVITLEGVGAEAASAVAQRLIGPCVVLPYAALRREWIAKPHDADIDATVAAQQLKLLTAGYVKAGYHVVLHGELDESRETLLRLMRMVPNVSALAVGVGPGVAAVDLSLNKGLGAAAIAEAVWAALPSDALTPGGSDA
jgi:hypothetical protein